MAPASTDGRPPTEAALQAIMSNERPREYTAEEIRNSRVFGLFALGAMVLFWGWMALHWPLYGYLYMVTSFGSMFGDDRVFPHQHVWFELAVLENFGALVFSLGFLWFILRVKIPPGGVKLDGSSGSKADRS
jgi:hypothetical protein